RRPGNTFNCENSLKKTSGLVVGVKLDKHRVRTRAAAVLNSHGPWNWRSGIRRQVTMPRLTQLDDVLFPVEARPVFAGANADKKAIVDTRRERPGDRRGEAVRDRIKRHERGQA